MSKIIQAVNAMISNHKLIDPVIRVDYSGELFFLYKGKHKWSISKAGTDQKDYYLHYYPGNQDLATLANFSEDQWRGFSEIVTYKSLEIGTREAFNSMQELYTIVSEKLFGMDDVLDDIIGDDQY